MQRMVGKKYDTERTKFLETLGLTVVRYWNHDVLGRVDVVLEDLWQVCFKLRNTLLQGGGIFIEYQITVEFIKVTPSSYV